MDCLGFCSCKVQALDLLRFWTAKWRVASSEESLHRHTAESQTDNTTMWGITNKKVWIYGGFYVAIIGTCIFLFLCAGWSFVPPSLVNYHQRSNMKGAISLLLIVHSSVHSVPPTFSKPYYDCRRKLINNTEWHDALNYKSFSYCLFICTAISICPWIQAEEGAFNSQLGTWFPWVLLRDSI